MTPKDKAYELFMDMKYHIPYVHDPTEPSEDKIAKQCALIAVDEILNNVMRWWETPIKDKYFIIQKTYWANVKQEIEKL